VYLSADEEEIAVSLSLLVFIIPLNGDVRCDNSQEEPLSKRSSTSKAALNSETATNSCQIPLSQDITTNTNITTSVEQPHIYPDQNTNNLIPIARIFQFPDIVSPSTLSWSPWPLQDQGDFGSPGLFDDFTVPWLGSDMVNPSYRDSEPVLASQQSVDVVPPVFDAVQFTEPMNFPPLVDNATLMSLIGVFKDRLLPVMPFFKGSYLTKHLASDRLVKDAQFRAMILAICALTLLQPQQTNDKGTPLHQINADLLIEEAMRLHSRPDFGESPTIAGVLTSTFLFACQFCKGRDNAAWLKLREAISLGELLNLHNARGYVDVDSDERDLRKRTYICLIVLERVFCIQRNLPMLRDQTRKQNLRQYLEEIHDELSPAEEPEELSTVQSMKEMAGVFEHIDEVPYACWGKTCNVDDRMHEHISAPTLSRILERYADETIAIETSSKAKIWTKSAPASCQTDEQSRVDATRQADIGITRQWMRNQMWRLAQRHKYLDQSRSYAELLSSNALIIAKEAVELCSSYDISILEVHGVGFLEKLFDIASSAISVFDFTDQTQDFREVLNRFTALFALFRGGKHAYLGKYLREIQHIDSDVCF
jgi:hypothetical protein